MTRILALLAAAAVLASASASVAAPCRDANGKFIACPTTKAAGPAERCRDSKGKFTKCTTSKSSAALSTKTTAATPAKK
jgi:hypothetical protein